MIRKRFVTVQNFDMWYRLGLEGMPDITKEGSYQRTGSFGMLKDNSRTQLCLH